MNKRISDRIQLALTKEAIDASREKIKAQQALNRENNKRWRLNGPRNWAWYDDEVGDHQRRGSSQPPRPSASSQAT